MSLCNLRRTDRPHLAVEELGTEDIRKEEKDLVFRVFDGGCGDISIDTVKFLPFACS